MILDCLKEIWRFGLKQSVHALLFSIIRNIDGPLGERVRYNYFKRKFRSIGIDVKIDTGVFIYGAENISVGNNVHIDKGVIIVAGGPDLSHRVLPEEKLDNAPVSPREVTIGNDVHISRYCGIHAYGGVAIGDRCVLSDNCKLYSLSNLPWDPANRKEVVSIMPYSGRSPMKCGVIELQENVWLGLNCIIMPGVRIGRNSFARSNSVITESFPENSYLRGDRAVRVGDRYQ